MGLAGECCYMACIRWVFCGAARNPAASAERMKPIRLDPASPTWISCILDREMGEALVTYGMQKRLDVITKLDLSHWSAESQRRTRDEEITLWPEVGRITA